MNATPCAFEACDRDGTERVLVTVGAASSWALRPTLLERADQELAAEGERAGVVLMCCPEHATGIAQATVRQARERLTAPERRILEHLEGRRGQGGDTVESTTAVLNFQPRAVATMFRHLQDVGLIQKGRYRGRTRTGRTVPKFVIRDPGAAPPPVQPQLLTPPSATVADGEEGLPTP